jgi:hypothetical protein
VYCKPGINIPNAATVANALKPIDFLINSILLFCLDLNSDSKKRIYFMVEKRIQQMGGFSQRKN